jgi:hypothetical protein
MTRLDTCEAVRLLDILDTSDPSLTGALAGLLEHGDPIARASVVNALIAVMLRSLFDGRVETWLVDESLRITSGTRSVTVIAPLIVRFGDRSMVPVFVTSAADAPFDGLLADAIERHRAAHRANDAAAHQRADVILVVDGDAELATALGVVAARLSASADAGKAVLAANRGARYARAF